jgi:hypothetical protein
MKKFLLMITCLVILFSLYACDYEGALCGSPENGEKASADTTGAKGNN